MFTKCKWPLTSCTLSIIYSLRSFSLKRLYLLKCISVYILFLIISRSSLILGTIKHFFLTELCALDIEKNQLFAVSVHFLCRGFNYLQFQVFFFAYVFKGRVHKCYTNISCFTLDSMFLLNWDK